MGFLWVIWPNMMRNYLRRKITRKLKWTVFIFAVVFGFYLIGVAFRLEGVLPKIAGLFGIIMLLKAILLVTTKSLEKAATLWAQLPLNTLRLWAAFVLCSGVILWNV